MAGMDVVGLGYPLVDIVVTLKDAKPLDQYGLKLGDAIVARPEHARLYEELVAGVYGPVQFVAGGSTLNTVRVTQWLLDAADRQARADSPSSTAGSAHASPALPGPVPARTSFIGSVGQDALAAQLVQCMRDDRVTPLLQTTVVRGEGDDAVPSPTTVSSTSGSSGTGTSAVLVLGGERSLVTYLGASRGMTTGLVDRPDVREALADTKVLYTCGFMCQTAAPHHYDVAIRAVQAVKGRAGATAYEGMGDTNGKGSTASQATGCTPPAHPLFAVNLSAVYIARDHTARLLSLMSRADLVFGNEGEAWALGKAMGWVQGQGGEEGQAVADDAMEDVVRRIAALPVSPDNLVHSRTVAITRGPRSTIVATCQHSGTGQGSTPSPADAAVQQAPVPSIPSSLVVDVTGAGDAFVGGFLAALLRGQSMARAAQAGHWAAGNVIQRIGATFDKADACPFL